MTSNRKLGFDVNAPGTTVFVIQVIFLVLAWITSLMRAFVKLVLLRRATIDDYLMLIALLGYTATAYFVFSAIIDGGLGRPATELGQESYETMLRSLYGNMTVSGPVSGLIRISIALFLSRIAVKKWHRIVLHSIIGTTIVTTAAYFFIVLLQCSPPSYFWERVRQGTLGSCNHSGAVRDATLVWGSFAAAMDWILGLLPITILWHVRINRRSRVGITALLSFGIIAGIALVIRLFYTGENGPTSSMPMAGSAQAIAISAIIELALGIIAGCIATLPPLFKRIGLCFGSGSKRRATGSVADTIPWQRSFAGPEPRHQGAESIIMMSPRRLESAEGNNLYDDEIQVRRPRVHSPSAKRVLSSSNWDIEIESAGAEDDDPLQPPSGKEIQVRTFIHVTSQPSDGTTGATGAIDFADKPLPLLPPPPRSKYRDRSIARSRPLTPNPFL
ncbi:hypothetical protein HD806DRAFT_177726 [Xylariaceae sp. AK1471]|nr:hypothetical protein HD806DRAFT_177726 [Xylariaceae sp. AK1471]